MQNLQYQKIGFAQVNLWQILQQDMQKIIEKFLSAIIAAGNAIEPLKKSRSKLANEIFVKAVTCLVTDAVAAKVASEKGYITVSRDAYSASSALSAKYYICYVASRLAHKFGASSIIPVTSLII